MYLFTGLILCMIQFPELTIVDAKLSHDSNWTKKHSHGVSNHNGILAGELPAVSSVYCLFVLTPHSLVQSLVLWFQKNYTWHSDFQGYISSVNPSAQLMSE